MLNGLVGAFTFAAGGTSVFYCCFANLDSIMLRQQPFNGVSLLLAFLGFLLMGMGLICIGEEVKPETKQIPS